MYEKSIILNNDFISVSSTLYKDGMVMKPHAHEHTSISIILKGQLSEKVDDKTNFGLCTQTIIKPAGIVHENVFSKDCYILSLTIKEDSILNQKQSEIMNEWGWISNSQTMKYFSQLIKAKNKSELKEVVKFFQKHLAENNLRLNSEVPNWLLEVKYYLDNNYQSGVRSDYLANQFNVHRVYLARVFKKHFGNTIKGYLNDVRLHNASSNVLQNQNSLTVTAFESGFSDQSHFNRKFKQSLEITPSEFQDLFTT